MGGEMGEVLTEDGEHVKLTFMRYSIDEVGREITYVNTHEQFPVIAKVLDRLKASASKAIVVHIPDEWATLKNRAVLSFAGPSMDYGIYEADGSPVMWVLQRKEGAADNVKPEWTMLGPKYYRFGMASPVSESKAREMRAKWRDMDANNEVESTGPWWLYMARDEVAEGDQPF